jgi:DNA-binding transcriptional LysR family regulator
VLSRWRPRSGIVHAVFPSRRGLLPAVRELIDFLAARYRDAEEPAATPTQRRIEDPVPRL